MDRALLPDLVHPGRAAAQAQDQHLPKSTNLFDQMQMAHMLLYQLENCATDEGDLILLTLLAQKCKEYNNSTSILDGESLEKIDSEATGGGNCHTSGIIPP